MHKYISFICAIGLLSGSWSSGLIAQGNESRIAEIREAPKLEGRLAELEDGVFLEFDPAARSVSFSEGKTLEVDPGVLVSKVIVSDDRVRGALLFSKRNAAGSPRYHSIAVFEKKEGWMFHALPLMNADNLRAIDGCDRGIVDVNADSIASFPELDIHLYENENPEPPTDTFWTWQRWNVMTKKTISILTRDPYDDHRLIPDAKPDARKSNRDAEAE